MSEYFRAGFNGGGESMLESKMKMKKNYLYIIIVIIIYNNIMLTTC